MAINLAYPVGDLLLLALLIGALALTGWRPDRSIALVGIGVCSAALADMSYLNAVAHGSSTRRPGLPRCGRRRRCVTALAAWQPVVTGRARCGSKAAGCSCFRSRR